MAITLYERFTSRETEISKDASITTRWLVTGSDDDADIDAFLDVNLPTTYRTLRRQKYHYAQIGLELWEVECPYVWDSSVDPTFSFDTTGNTAHITQSLQTQGVYVPPGRSAPDFGGAIGVTKDSVEGVDIVIPGYAWTETYTIEEITDSYKALLKRMTGRFNNAVFRTWEAGEVLFLGARGQKNGYLDPWEITFHFAGSDNVTSLVQNGITIAAKRGWDYLWFRYADFKDDAAAMLVKRPIAAVVEQVYYPDDFSLLGIGT